MAQSLSSSTSEAGPSTFPSNQDFIAFEASDDEAQEESNGQERNGSGPASEALEGATPLEQGRSQTNGKKRKLDENSIDVPRNGSGAKTREARKGTPWCVDVDFDQCPTCADVLHDELMAFEHWISPTRIEHETRKLVIKMIAKAIIGQWPDADVRAFGSQNTQLYMPQGDIDLVVISRRMDDRRREDVLRSMAACLRRNNLATDIQVIAKAKVPIIKFVCTYGKYKVDISINQTNGLDASKFVSDWLKKCPALRPIIMATKLLLSQRGVSEVFSGGLGSYSVICLAISHMQMHPKVQRGEIDPIRNLGVLFLEFLELYGKNFGYDEVGISVVARGCYFRKVARGWKNERQPLMLSIEDPGDASNDISKGSFNMREVKQAFSGAFDILTAVMCEPKGEKGDKKRHRRDLDEDEEAREALIDGARSGDGGDKDPESLLGHIVGVNREMLKARRDIQQLWDSGTLQFKMGKPAPRQEPLPHQPAPGATPRPKEIPRAPKAMREKEERHSASSAAKETKREEERSSKKKRKEARKAEKAEKKTKGLSIKGSAPQLSSTSKGTAGGVKGSASDPVVVMDDSSRNEDHRGSGHRGSDMARDFLPIDLDASPVLAREDEDDHDSADDTKYNNHSRSKARMSRLDDFAKSAPKTFVLDDSASEEEDDAAAASESPEEGEVVTTGERKRKGGRSEEDEAKRKRKREYWEGKGNSIAANDSDDLAWIE